MVSFGELCPEVANEQLLQLHIPHEPVPHEPAPGRSLPDGHYAFLEFYCPHPDCDCQMVLWRVHLRLPDEPNFPASRPAVATFAWCWDGDHPGGPHEEPGPTSRLSPLLLTALKRAVRFQGYGKVVKGHYQLVRTEALRPGSAAYGLLHPEQRPRETRLDP